MSEYTQGVCQDGAAILRDGKPLTIEEILDGLRHADELAEALGSLLDELFDVRCESRFNGLVDADEVLDSIGPAIDSLTNYSKSKGE